MKSGYNMAYPKFLENTQGAIMKKISTDSAPAAIGPYSQAITAEGVVYVSGQIPVNPASGAIEAKDIAGQTRQCMENIKAVLEAAGTGTHRVVRCGVFLTDMGGFSAMNEVYAQYFSEPYPARAAVQVAALPKGALVEIDCIAVL